MDYRIDPLWLKLMAMNMQGAAAFAPFMETVQKQMGMSRDLASRVIEEYRKFLFLAMRAGHQVMPPGAFGEAWMLQMQNAQDFWEKLGDTVGERPAPGESKTGPADPWTETLKSYERIFGMKPPMDIWGAGSASANPWMQWGANMRKMWGLE